jgi:hypothetical protein
MQGALWCRRPRVPMLSCDTIAANAGIQENTVGARLPCSLLTKAKVLINPIN